MPRFFPDRPSEDTPRSERVAWQALEALPNSWRVFHSVAWQIPKKSRVFDGEADFVLLHPKHGMIVVEVKGGLLEVRDGSWYQRNASGGSWHRLPRSPYDQAKGAMYDLRHYLEQAVPGLTSLPSSRAVLLPAASHPGDLGPDKPPEMTFAREDLRTLPAAVEKLVSYARLNADLTSDQMTGITSRLAPTVTIRTTIGTELAAAERELLDLTAGQIRVLDLLRRHRRALITGSAGTGKTVLAIERARRLADDGARVLLTCYNRPLGEHLESATADSPNITGSNFHSFGRRLLKDAGYEDLPLRVSAEWFREHMPELIMKAVETTGVSFDAIVVDEGQDFTPEWFMALQILLDDPDNGPFYVFADPNQAIYVEGWEPPIDDAPFPLDINCRNTLPIAEKVAAVYGHEPAALGASGLAPQFIVANEDNEKLEVLEIAIKKMITEEDVSPGQITVLTSHRRHADALQGRVVGGTLIGPLGTDGVVAETIHRYKGLENDVVFVALDDVKTAQQKALAYIGMSRAKSLLIVTGSKAAKRAIGW